MGLERHAVDLLIDDLAAAIVERHEIEPLPRVREQLLERLIVAVTEVETSYINEIGTAPQLLPDEQGAPIVLKIWTCPECGARPETVAIVPPRCYAHGGTEQTLLDGIVMVATDYKPRKLPEGFLHLESSLPGGISKRWLTGLQRNLEGSGTVTVRLPEVGAHEENARAVLRWLAERAGHHPERNGRFSFEGDGAGAIARWVYMP